MHTLPALQLAALYWCISDQKRVLCRSASEPSDSL